MDNPWTCKNKSKDKQQLIAKNHSRAYVYIFLIDLWHIKNWVV